MPAKVLCVVGTRPEAIKMSPVVKALRVAGYEAPILATGQHRSLLDQMLKTFDLVPDWDLNAMLPSQTLASLTGTLVPALDRIIRKSGADAVLAQGDTTTVFCTALAAFYAGIPFGHVEAGLRSGDMTAPFPEEGMRRLTAPLAHWHFAPTNGARLSLLREGHQDSDIHVVGNTVIDALMDIAARPDLHGPVVPLAPGERLILVTLHRRENFGLPLKRILTSLANFAKTHPTAHLLYPVHPNPHVKAPANEILAGLPNVHLVEPMDYPMMVRAMKSAFIVLTDSGGIQEEAPALGKPVLVFRDVTERPEAVAAGGVHLIGSSPKLFKEEMARLWDDRNAYQGMAQRRFPYGDGQASQKIVDVLTQSFARTCDDPIPDERSQFTAVG